VAVYCVHCVDAIVAELTSFQMPRCYYCPTPFRAEIYLYSYCLILVGVVNVSLCVLFTLCLVHVLGFFF
jgi:hypothetical protein